MDPSGTCRGRLRGPAAPLVEILPKEKMPVLKSEDLFECPAELLKPILTFLDLPNCKPDAWERGKERRYEEMDLAIKRRLEEYFEPHNGRLYDFLGADLGW
jgi:hypothetical protein